jgi:hypothetical protein
MLFDRLHKIAQTEDQSVWATLYLLPMRPNRTLRRPHICFGQSRLWVDFCPSRRAEIGQKLPLESRENKSLCKTRKDARASARLLNRTAIRA